VVFLGVASGVLGQEVIRPTGPVDPVGTPPSNHQDSVRLTRATSAVLPPDGLWSVGLGGRTYNTVYLLDDFLRRINQKDAFLQTELALWTWLNVWAELPFRTWSNGTSYVPESGSGLGDGQWQLTLGRPLKQDFLNGALLAGGNLPVGDQDQGLAEGVFSPRAGGALTFRFWTDNQVPEMRVHLNAWYRWNRAEDTGYGTGQRGLEPWPPRYQSAAVAGGTSRNDALALAGALEFRKGTTSLWLEYSQERFQDNATVSSGEQLRMFGAGLRWGVVEGWAVHGDYLISLANDDETTAWFPAYPDWMMSVAVSYQFSTGGRDRDGDGIVDRKDACPDLPEDHDGWRDSDGCPDYDNDLDGVADLQDGAPDEPEDYDGFLDLDGIPDRDNDQDGIPDRKDLCPDEPEDFDGHNDTDGCPDDFADADGDGVEDDSDLCPDRPEDKDGFEDTDGCPEEDNDLDGIPDGEDDCPDEPEDYDGDNDKDGCPE
jgi:hypothetical protein